VVRDELGFHTTGKREEVPEADLSAAEMPTGWYLIVSNRSEKVVPDSVMQHLSSSGCELVTCFVEEHVMCSFATGWKDGRRRWSVSHDSQQGIEHLDTEGDLPPDFSSIRDRLLSKQREEDSWKPQKPHSLFQGKITRLSQMRCDYVFDIPVATAQSLTGYRYDQDVPGLSGEPFEVLVCAVPERSAPQEKPSFFKRLFGA
jgi:hypothetical protein